MRRWLIAACVLCLPLAAQAEQGWVRVDHAWARPAMAGHNGVVYLNITEHRQADRLVAVSSPVARQAELHETIDDHGVMKMRRVAALPLRPGQTVMLRPGGYHIMLLDLKHQLSPGDSVPVTLTFEKGGKVSTMAMVEGRGAPPMQHPRRP